MLPKNEEFWMNLGTQIGTAIECSKGLEKRFEKFCENEFQHLVEKTDKNSKYIWIGVGIVTTLQVVLNVALFLILK